VCLRENGIAFETALSTGQKTGWFYDHRENRRWLQQLSADKRVLDVFSYAGAWSLNALIGNAASVTAIDASAAALASAEHNARLNGVDGRFRSLQGDAADVLRALADASEQFDIVVLDPPAFIKRKKDQRAGLRQYEQINQLACRLLSPHGILISASCSQHLQANALKTAMLRGARKQGRELQILQQGGQGPDHPVNAAMPETAYLKAFCARLL
jgi:23S rRNA (cytosine1962-C5)-methyltransferase